jgi:GNAT superfamily N-acetyltransferase
MVVRIRACETGDARALALVGKATFLETYAGALDAPDIFDHCDVEHGEPRYAAWLKTPGYRLWLAEMVEGQAPVGYAVLGPTDLPIRTTVRDLELKRLYLLHRFHGTGLGQELMQTVLDAAAADAQRLLLGVYDENPRALAFYVRQGFAPAGRRIFQVGSREYDDLVMAKIL